jgi:hypothetical protein
MNMAGTYLVAIGAILFSAASASTLIYTLKHFDPARSLGHGHD